MRRVHRNLSRADVEALRLRLAELVPIKQASISLLLRMMRLIARKSQSEYARMCGVAPRVLAAIEAGTGSPTVETLEKLLRPFGYRVGVVMDATEGWEGWAGKVGDVEGRQRALASILGTPPRGQARGALGSLAGAESGRRRGALAAALSEQPGSQRSQLEAALDHDPQHRRGALESALRYKTEQSPQSAVETAFRQTTRPRNALEDASGGQRAPRRSQLQSRPPRSAPISQLAHDRAPSRGALEGARGANSALESALTRALRKSRKKDE